MIQFNIPHLTKVFYTTYTGETGTIMVIDEKILLSRGKIYKIPVNTNESLDQHNIIKVIGSLNEILDVRNIENGFATVQPIVQNVLIFNKMELGIFI